MDGANIATRAGEGDAYVFNFQPGLDRLNKVILTKQANEQKSKQIAQSALDKMMAETAVGKQGLQGKDIPEYMQAAKEYEAYGKAEIAETDLGKKAQLNALKNNAYGRMAMTTADSKQDSKDGTTHLSGYTQNPAGFKETGNINGREMPMAEYLDAVRSMPSSMVKKQGLLDASKLLNTDAPYDAKNNNATILGKTPISNYEAHPTDNTLQVKVVKNVSNPLSVMADKTINEVAMQPKLLRNVNKIVKDDMASGRFEKVTQFAKDQNFDLDQFKNDKNGFNAAYYAAALKMDNPDKEITRGAYEQTAVSKRDDKKNAAALVASNSRKAADLVYSRRESKSANGGMEDLFGTIPDSDKGIPISNLDPRLGTMALNIAKEYGKIKVKVKDPTTNQITTEDREVNSGDIAIWKGDDGKKYIHRVIKEDRGDGTIRSIAGERLAPFSYLQVNSKINTDKSSRNTMRQNAGSQTSAPQVATPHQAAPKKTISRGDIATKAAAAGYGAKEYEALLIKNGITIK